MDRAIPSLPTSDPKVPFGTQIHLSILEGLRRNSNGSRTVTKMVNDALRRYLRKLEGKPEETR